MKGINLGLLDQQLVLKVLLLRKMLNENPFIHQAILRLVSQGDALAWLDERLKIVLLSVTR
jgi:hypothetical protein